MATQVTLWTLLVVTDLVQNPTLPVRLHRDASRAAALARAVEMLELVGIPNPARCAQSYPHQLSGGMRQLAVIAPANNIDRLPDQTGDTSIACTHRMMVVCALCRPRSAIISTTSPQT